MVSETRNHVLSCIAAINFDMLTCFHLLSYELAAECTNVEPVFPCYVINGRVRVYSSTKLDEETQNVVRSAIQESIENGNLADSDNRFLDVTWGMFSDTPGGGGEGPGGGDNGGGGNGGGDNGGGDPNEGNDIDRADTTGGGLEPWAWALVAIGGFVFLVMLYFCFRRPRRQVGADDDDDDDDSSSRKSSSHESQSESVEEKDVYADEYDEARTTPLIRNTSANNLDATGTIEEESENDVSNEDLKSSDVGASVSSHHSHSTGSGSYQDSAPPEYDSSEMSREMDSQDPQKYVGQPAPTEDDSAYSSYEDQVEEEYEIEYLQASQRSGNWADGQEEYSYEASSDANSNPSPESSLPHSRQRESGSSFDAMRKKWEH